MADLSKIKTFVLDMDGTIYLSNRLFDCTLPFLQHLKNTGREFFFYTNNSSRSINDYLAKLEKMNVPADRAHMLSSVDVTLEYLHKHHPGQSVYLIGTKALEQQFIDAGIRLCEDADLMILGFDTELDYKKLVIGCDLLRAGKPFYAINPDFNCPVEDGFIPDCGSMARLITASTGVEPEYFGKPTRHTLDFLLEKTGCRPEELAVVGDRLYTDIALAQDTPVTSILVWSGEATPEELAASPFKPDLIADDIGALIPML